MTVYSLFPAFVQLHYHSASGVHVQTIPTLSFDPGSGDFDTHGGGAILADTMISALVTDLVKLYPDDVFYDNYRIFTMASEVADPLLVFAAAFVSGNQGTFSSPGYTAAVQGTLSYLGTGGSKGKLVFLDAASGDNYDPQFTPGSSGPLFDIFTEISNPSNGWATRAGERPATFLEYAKTLNEKLRREYRLF